MKELLYCLSKYVYKILSSLFFVYLLIIGIFYCMGICIHSFLGYLFFFLLGLWLGCLITFAAIRIQRKEETKRAKRFEGVP